MESCQADSSENNHRTFQDHEGNLIVRQLAIEAFTQLCDAETGADEDANCC